MHYTCHNFLMLPSLREAKIGVGVNVVNATVRGEGGLIWLFLSMNSAVDVWCSGDIYIICHLN